MGEPATQLAQFVEAVETFGAGGGATVFATGSTEQQVLRNVLPAYDRDGQSHVAEATVVYQDAEFCVCRYETHREQPFRGDEAVQRHVWWVFGIDEFRDDRLVGVKLGNRGNENDVDVWTRERVLDLLKLDSWAPLPSNVTDAGDPEVEYRLQGRVGLSWVSPQQFLDGCRRNYPDERFEWDMFEERRGPATFVLTNQTLTLSEATGIGQPIEPPSSGRQHPHIGTVAYVPDGTSLFTVSERYRDREVTLPEGVYSFMPVGETPISERSRGFR